ncbi:MAG: hypothetical protein ABSB71_13245 [Candidatus Bathyarchaeia archaeon]
MSQLFGAMASLLMSVFGFGFRKLSGGGAELPMLMVKRAPLWTYPTKSVPAEKAQRKKAAQLGNQRKLLEVSV